MFLACASVYLALGLFEVEAGGLAAILLCGVVWLYLRLAPTHVIVGDDGVAIRWLRRTRFIPYGELRSVRKLNVGAGLGRHLLVTLSVVNSSDVQFAFEPQSGIGEEACASIRARAKRAAGRTPPPTLPPGMNSAHDDLRRLQHAHPGSPYRLQGVSMRDCWKVLEHPSAEPADRGAAACAVAGRCGDDGHERFARLARSTAEPTLRRLLLSLARRDSDGARDAFDRLARLRRSNSDG